MAALALGFVGTAIGGSIGGTFLGVTAASIGGFIGSTIGSFIDNRLFNSGQKQEGPRLEDLSVTVSVVGNPIPLLYGPENRVGGNVIWSSGLIETAQTRKEGGKGGGPSVSITEYTYRTSVAVGLGAGVIRDVTKIWMNGQLVYDRDSGSDAGLWSSMTVYPGSLTQAADPTMQSYLGVGQTPAYIGTAYIVIADLQLADFGNRLPNIECLVDAGEDTLDGICRDIMGRCGLDPNFQSVGTLGGAVRGYAIGRQVNGIAALQPLALAYRFNVAEHCGDLRFSYRDSAPLATIRSDLLAGYQFGASRPDKIQWVRAIESALPKSASLQYPDPERDYQANAQHRNREAGEATNDLSNSIPIVLTADEAQQLVDSLLFEAWMARETAKFTVDDRLLSLVVDRAYWFETPVGFEPLTITRRTRGANGVIEIEAIRNRLEVYRSTNPGASAAVPPQTVLAPDEATLILLDIPILLDADDDAGFYWGVVGSGGAWRGADFKRATDAAGPYTQVEAQGFEATVGDVTGILGAGPEDVESDEIDATTVLTVVLRHSGMELSSVSDADLEAGANAAYVGPVDGHGGEIIQFKTATLVGANTYQLTNLLRGRKGTEFARDEHAADEMFVLLEQGPIRRANFDTPDLNLERAYKAVALLTAEADADAVLFTNTGVGLRPYSPIFLEVAGDTGDDLELSWTRRSRLESGALGEEEELYRVRIMNALGTVVIREVDVTEPAFTYTAAMQTADFGGPVSDLRWRVAQVSAVYGPGIFAEQSGPV